MRCLISGAMHGLSWQALSGSRPSGQGLDMARKSLLEVAASQAAQECSGLMLF